MLKYLSNKKICHLFLFVLNSGNPIALGDDIGSSLLSPALDSLPALSLLAIGACNLPMTAIATLFAVLSAGTDDDRICPKLTTLELADNEIRGDACETMLAALISSRPLLQNLDLAGCRLTKPGLVRLSSPFFSAIQKKLSFSTLISRQIGFVDWGFGKVTFASFDSGPKHSCRRSIEHIGSSSCWIAHVVPTRV